MASTVIRRTRGQMGPVDENVFVLDITSYPTGGEVITPAIAGLEGSQKIELTSVIGMEAGGLDKTFQWDRANEKLKIAVANTGAEVANGTDLGEFVITAISLAGKPN